MAVEWAGCIRAAQLPMQELLLKIGGGLISRGGVVTGFYGICKYIDMYQYTNL